MKIEKLHEHFHNRIALITAYQRAARDLATQQLEKMGNFIERKNKNPEDYTGPMSSMNFSYTNPIDGNRAFYGRHTRTAEEVKEYLELQLNKQYQWLLAEAYEEFEDFIEAAYASAGFFDNDFWPLSDFGEIFINEIRLKDWNWYLSQSRKKKGAPESIIKHFRKKLPEFARLEQHNALDADLRLSLALITQMRHHIVHTSGNVVDRENFVEKVLSSVGMYCNGKPSEDNRSYIDSYFCQSPHHQTIALLDIPHPDSGKPFKLYISAFDQTVGALLATAHCLRTALENHQARSTQTPQE